MIIFFIVSIVVAGLYDKTSLVNNNIKLKAVEP